MVSIRIWLLGIAVAIKFLAASALAFLPPASGYRNLVGVIITILGFIFYRDTQLLEAEALKIALNTFSVIQLGNILDVVCISRLSFPHRLKVPSTTTSSQDATKDKLIEAKPTVANKFTWGLATIWNFRGVRTPEEVKNIPGFRRNDKASIPSRGSFLLRRLIVIVIRIAILKSWGEGWPLLNPRVDMAFPKEYFFSRLQDVTSNEILVRIWATILFWVRGYLNHSLAYEVLSVITVSLGFSQPQNWPPMYSSLLDCNSVRAWWGKSWHQLLRKQLTSFSNFIVFEICRLRRNSILARYCNLFLTFWISGVYHILSDGLDTETGAVWFFIMQAIGITFEDAMQEVYRRSERPLKGIWRIVGYIWVFVFLVWTSPSWRYPVLRYRFRHVEL
ncbi:membrane bound O-acyl transferase family-domain-containing protein [Xylogone sp. PMI_703]|nr:membrane bound O-acyl transferase family-domain-containing protein [Xylogone sp. PMI_703]